MNYRHAFHAGNFADVVKHVALVAILLHLRKKEAPFAVIDSHAGRGLYDLSAEEARKTGEAQSGIARVRDLHGPEALNRYLGLVLESGLAMYPGSPLLAAKLLRPQDRLVAIEQHPEEWDLLRQVVAPYRKARAEEGDGYARLAALLPPPERRGLILIDPPFETPDEFEKMAEILAMAWRRFATGIFLIWYPIKSEGQAGAFEGEVLAKIQAGILRIETAITAAEGRLARAGLLVVNPPYGFEPGMRETMELVVPRLPGGQGRLEWLHEPA